MTNQIVIAVALIAMLPGLASLPKAERISAPVDMGALFK